MLSSGNLPGNANVIPMTKKGSPGNVINIHNVIEEKEVISLVCSILLSEEKDEDLLTCVFVRQRATSSKWIRGPK